MTSSSERPLSDSAVPAPLGFGAAREWVRLLRPRQWIKNFFVLAPLLFSGRAMQATWQGKALLAFAAFSLLASAAYLMNDVLDREADRAHPTKRFRPIAANTISARSATAASILLGLLGVTAGFAAAPMMGVYALSYLALNVVYSSWLKHVVILDVFAISAFFVLRLLGGAAAVEVRPSLWLLLCGGLLALFLGFAKRRHELVLLGENSNDHRAVLSLYTTGFLDQLSVVLLAVTVISYIMYTVESDTARQVGGDVLSYSTVFVLYGVIRYLYLVHQQRDSNPTDTLLTDRALLASVLLWVGYCGTVIYWFRVR